MKKINEMIANIDEVVIYEMPQMKIAGREVRCVGQIFLEIRQASYGKLYEHVTSDNWEENIK